MKFIENADSTIEGVPSEKNKTRSKKTGEHLNFNTHEHELNVQREKEEQDINKYINLGKNNFDSNLYTEEITI